MHKTPIWIFLLLFSTFERSAGMTFRIGFLNSTVNNNTAKQLRCRVVKLSCCMADRAMPCSDAVIVANAGLAAVGSKIIVQVRNYSTAADLTRETISLLSRDASRCATLVILGALTGCSAGLSME